MTLAELLSGRTDAPLLENEAFRVLLAALWSEVAAERHELSAVAAAVALAVNASSQTR